MCENHLNKEISKWATKYIFVHKIKIGISKIVSVYRKNLVRKLLISENGRNHSNRSSKKNDSFCQACCDRYFKIFNIQIINLIEICNIVLFVYLKNSAEKSGYHTLHVEAESRFYLVFYVPWRRLLRRKIVWIVCVVLKGRNSPRLRKSWNVV